MAADTPGRTSGHRFGGPWTEVKLDAIGDYLAFFTTALRNKPTASRSFELWYIDAFAGSGDRTETRETGGLLERQPVTTADVTLDGSARRALAVSPPFTHYVFIEQDVARATALQALVDASADRRVVVKTGDGNRELRELFATPPWSTQQKGRGLHRGVVFLDPYAMSVRWKTLEVLAETGAVDVWYLFPLAAVVRQLAREYEAVDASKQRSLDEIFGTRNWRTELYQQEVELDLWGTEKARTTRAASKDQIEAYARRRLETLFRYASAPLPLLTPRGTQLFSLFCLSANESPAAINLIKRGVAHVLKKYG